MQFPKTASHSSGTVKPRVGFKRFVTDPKLAPARVPTYGRRKDDVNKCKRQGEVDMSRGGCWSS